MFGTISDEIEVKASASEAWKIYGTLRMPEIVLEHLSGIIEKIDVLEGDGGAGTVLNFTFRPGTTGYSHYTEKFTVIDNEKRVKVAEGIEGGYLEQGMDHYRVRFEIIEKQKQGEQGEDSCITKAIVEYETKDLEAAKLALASIQSDVSVMKAIADRLTKSSN